MIKPYGDKLKNISTVAHINTLKQILYRICSITHSYSMKSLVFGLLVAAIQVYNLKMFHYSVTPH
jgi:hypothetical protein